MTDLLIGYLEQAAALAPVWGFLLVFVFMTVESSFVPFPSEVVMIPAGFLAARSSLTLGAPIPDAAVAVIMGTLGSLAGAYLNYFLALRLGKPFLNRWGKYILLGPDKLERAEELFLRYGAGATFVCRLLPAIRQLISIPAGISKMPLRSFTLWTGLGAGVWVIILTAVGYAFGTSTAHMSWADLVHEGGHQVKSNLLYIAPVLVLGFIGYVVLSNRIMRREAKASAGADAGADARAGADAAGETNPGA